MGTFNFLAGDAQTVKLYKEKVVRDAEKQMFFSPLVYKKRTGKDEMEPDDPERAQGLIQYHTEFAEKAGDRLTINNVARITGRGTHGDALLANTGANLNYNSMNLYIEPVAHQVKSSGPLSERRVAMDFIEDSTIELTSWLARKLEEAIMLTLAGLVTWNNSPYDNWNNTGETAVFLNAIQAFDSTHQLYAGDATTNATIDAADKLSAQVLMKAETTAFEDLAIPLDPFRIAGEDCLLGFVGNRGKEQLLTDEETREALLQTERSKDTPLLRNSIGRLGRIWIIPYPKMPNPAANVGTLILCGKNAVQMARFDDDDEETWWYGFEDNMKRRKVVALGGTYGMASTYLNSTRRNALAINFYQRS